MSDPKEVRAELVNVRPATEPPAERPMTLDELVDVVADRADELVSAGQRAKVRGMSIMQRLGVELGTEPRTRRKR